MAPLPGFRKLKGGSERYRPPANWQGRTYADGTISRRQYENHRLRLLGWRNWSEYQRDSRTDDYRRWKGEFAAKSKEEGPSGGTWAGPNSEFAQSWLDAKRSNWSTDAHGPFADFLVQIGLREPEWDFDVGCTNIEIERGNAPSLTQPAI